MKEDRLNKIASIEKVIKNKYGKEAIQNPKANWSKEKEDKFVKDSKKFYKERLSRKHGDFIKKVTHKTGENCSTCFKEWFFMTLEDEVSCLKWSVCRDCYIKYIDGREERWASGWRPDKESVFRN